MDLHASEPACHARLGFHSSRAQNRLCTGAFVVGGILRDGCGLGFVLARLEGPRRVSGRSDETVLGGCVRCSNVYRRLDMGTDNQFTSSQPGERRLFDWLSAGVGKKQCESKSPGVVGVMPKQTTYTFRLDPTKARELELWLRSNSYEFKKVPYAKFAAEKDKVSIAYYESGKLVVQGANASDFVEFVLEPVILKEARLGYEAVLDPDLLLPRVGVDESGKGDLFGPLCVAAVYVNESVIRAWENSGIRDSKRVSSDNRVIELAQTIRATPGCKFNVVRIGNAAYNKLRRKMGSVNEILAWGHARAIENLLQGGDLTPPPVKIISDQFAANPATLGQALMKLGRQVELVQRHKAESDLAVAAASILAREAFILGLKRMEKLYGMVFPKGASTSADEALKEFVKRHGAARAEHVAKMHFRNASRIVGQTEAP